MHTTELLEILSAFILASSIAIVAARWVRTAISLYVTQSLLLGGIAALVAFRVSEPHLLVAAALAVCVKAIAIPLVMRYVLSHVKARIQVESYLGVPSSLMVTSLLVAIAYFAANTALGLGLDELPSMPGNLLAISLSDVLIGFFVILGRKNTILQVVGVSVMENGIFLAALTLTSGMPSIIELGIFFELLVGAILMGMLIFKIRDAFDTINATELRTLKDYRP